MYIQIVMWAGSEQSQKARPCVFCTTELGGLYTDFVFFGPCVLCRLSFNGFYLSLGMYVLNLKGLFFSTGVCVYLYRCVCCIVLCKRCFTSVAVPITFAICPISARRNLCGQIFPNVHLGCDSRAKIILSSLGL